MLAWTLTAFGSPARLSLIERPIPPPGIGEVLVDIHAVSLNYRDIAIADGRYAPGQPLPLIPASDAVGTVAAIGPGVTRWRPGDRVLTCYMQSWDRGPSRASDRLQTLGSPLDGVLCEQRLFAQDSLVAAPTHLSDVQGATLPIAGVTAWCSLFDAGAARPGETVLVQGSGGVATFAIQLARAAGMKVVVVSRSAAKLERARALGAHVLIDSGVNPDWADAVLAATDQAGADVILDVGGSSTLRQSLKSAAQNARIIAIGFLGGADPQVSLRQMMAKNVTVRGVTVGSRSSLEALLGFITLHAIGPVIDRVFDFGDAPAAFARLASGDQQGKICIQVRARQ